MSWKIIGCLFLLPIWAFAQSDYTLHNFLLLKHVELEGEFTSSKGLLAQFELAHLKSTPQHTKIEVELYSSSFLVFKCSKNVALSDTNRLVQIGIPYKDIELEEGVHNVKLVLKINKNPVPVYRERLRLQQPKVFDLFLNLEQATVLPDSGYNPIGLNNNAPDPVWMLQIYDTEKKGITERNSFQPLPLQVTTTATTFDSIMIGVYDIDPVYTRWLGQYPLTGNNKTFEKEITKALPPQVEKSSFGIQWLERTPANSSFTLVENIVHQGIRGVRLKFNYQLPYYFRKKNIRIHLKDDKNQSINNFLPLKEDRKQIKNQIVGEYHYFIPYHNLQQTKQVSIHLIANKVTVQQHSTSPLNIPKTVDDVSITQKTAHQKDGISGILYRLDYQLPELDPTSVLTLQFPSLTDETLEKMTYWSANTPNDIQQATTGKIPTLQQQTIFVFLPYFVAPTKIHLHPQLWLENNHIPPIKMATFESKPYTRPTSLSDITIETSLSDERQYTGLSGQWFEFGTNIPDYYHSKGDFVIQILEDGVPMREGYFINGDCYGKVKEPIKNQKKITVFIPYRAMQAGKRYQVILQAKNKDFGLSETRQEQFDNPMQTIVNKAIYLPQLITQDWKKVVFQIHIRNFKNQNQTYPHLGYKTIVQDTIQSPHRPRMATTTYNIQCHPKDEIIFSFYELGQPFDRAQQIKTSLEALKQNNNQLQLKNEENIKMLLLKVVDK